MAGKNKYLAERDAMRQGFFKAGLEHGRQQIIDMMSLVLRDPKYVGQDTFGGKRLIQVVQGINDYIDKYQLAWEKHDETDHVRTKLDDNLAEAYGEKLHDSFMIRYPYAPEFDYVKGKWK